MRSFRHAKAMAKSLRESLSEKGVSLSHSECLELVAKEFGLADWNTLSAAIDAQGTDSTADALSQPTALQFKRIIPIIRIFDEAKAREFYVDFMGFTVDWEHRFHPNAPLYMQVSRSGVTLHLSEHYGDGTPGSVVYIRGRNIAALAKEMNAKGARFARPSPTNTHPTMTDPFGNVLRFDDESNQH